MRIAWTGPAPTEMSGATYVATLLLRELDAMGVDVVCFATGRREDVASSVLGLENVRVHMTPNTWEWDRWYSRTPLASFFSGSASRLRAQMHVATAIAARHREQPFDVVYQFSQSEFAPLRLRASVLPPIVVHPSTHAAGELRWHRREQALLERAEPWPRRTLARALLVTRARGQRRELPKAARVLGVSRIFSDHLIRDYALPPERVGVVPNPIDLSRFRVSDDDPGDGPLTVLYVSRISTRKGVDMVIALSHRLADLAGRVALHVVGGATTWSDYRPLLRDLNPDVATYHGSLAPERLADLYRRAHLVVQPSLYEPFGLTVAESLASGVPVVASDEVGAIEGVDRSVCGVFPNGDLDAFERAVRTHLERMSGPERAELRARSRSEAERLFAARPIAARLVDELRAALAGTGATG